MKHWADFDEILRNSLLRRRLQLFNFWSWIDSRWLPRATHFVELKNSYSFVSFPNIKQKFVVVVAESHT